MNLKSEIRRILVTEGAIRKEELFSRVEHLITVPSSEKMAHSHKMGKLNRNIASLKEADGERGIYLIEHNGVHEYVNIYTCKDPKKIQLVLEKLDRQKQGLMRARQAVKKRYMKVLKGQISLFEQEGKKAK